MIFTLLRECVQVYIILIFILCSVFTHSVHNVLHVIQTILLLSHIVTTCVVVFPDGGTTFHERPKRSLYNVMAVCELPWVVNTHRPIHYICFTKQLMPETATTLQQNLGICVAKFKHDQIVRLYISQYDSDRNLSQIRPWQTRRSTETRNWRCYCSKCMFQVVCS